MQRHMEFEVNASHIQGKDGGVLGIDIYESVLACDVKGSPRSKYANVVVVLRRTSNVENFCLLWLSAQVTS